MEVNNDSEVSRSESVEETKSSEAASEIESSTENSPEEGLAMEVESSDSSGDYNESSEDGTEQVARASEMYDSELTKADSGSELTTSATQANGDTGLADDRGDPLTYELARETYDDAILSMDSYNDFGSEETRLDEAIGSYERQSAEQLSQDIGQNVVLDDPDTGFNAAVYKTEGENGAPDHYTVAYRGSEANDLNDVQSDWLNSNFGQAFGNEVPESYQQASELAEQMKQAYGADNVSLTGHSLGGGMANYAAIDNNLDYNIFNAAGLSQTSINELGSKVDNYTGTGNVINDEYDPLTNYGGKYNDQTWGRNAQHVGEDNLVFMDNNNFNWFDTGLNFNKRVQAHNLQHMLPGLANAAGYA